MHAGVGIARVKRMLTGPVNSEIRIKGRHVSKAAVASPCLYEVMLLRSAGGAGGGATEKHSPAKRTPCKVTPLTPVTVELASPVVLESEKGGAQQLREWTEYYLVEEASVEAETLRRHATELAQDVCDAFEMLRAKTSGAHSVQDNGSGEQNSIAYIERNAKADDKALQTSNMSDAKTKMRYVYEGMDEEDGEGEMCAGERKQFADAVRNAAAAAQADFAVQHNVMQKCKQDAATLQQASCSIVSSDHTINLAECLSIHVLKLCY